MQKNQPLMFAPNINFCIENRLDNWVWNVASLSLTVFQVRGESFAKIAKSMNFRSLQHTKGDRWNYFIALISSEVLGHYLIMEHSTEQHSTVYTSTAQHNTAQPSIAQHNTAQHAAQYSTAQHSKKKKHNTTTTQHNTTQRNATQPNETQHNTAQPSPAQPSMQHSKAQHTLYA